MQGIGRFTVVDSASVDIDGNGGRLIRLIDERVFDYPWLYAVEVGQWYLDDDEATLLREYLDRGGFLMVDDFWGEHEWSIFTDSMQRVFPDRRIEELGEDHELLHVLYDLDQRTQIPGRGGQRPGTVPHWRGIFDDDGRLMVAINFNMDMGDAWEHADDPWYPEPMTALAYQLRRELPHLLDDALSTLARAERALQRKRRARDAVARERADPCLAPDGQHHRRVAEASRRRRRRDHRVAASSRDRSRRRSSGAGTPTSFAMSCSRARRAAALGDVVRHSGRHQAGRPAPRCTLSGVNRSGRVVRSCRAGLLCENATIVCRPDEAT